MSSFKIAQSRSDIVISQRKYALDILEETGMMGCRPIDTPMDPNVKLLPGQESHLFMTSPCDSHREAVVRILRYIKSAPGRGQLFEDQGHEHIIGYRVVDWAGSPSNRRLTSRYCILVGVNCLKCGAEKYQKYLKNKAVIPKILGNAGAKIARNAIPNP
uniref:Reverse transcriptase Ty1/copia-type domain-containing protein n=1 Tax=Solanum lycopersicum TaxID=4081 RepID=A0A3Q7GP51_SOLLC